MKESVNVIIDAETGELIETYGVFIPEYESKEKEKRKGNIRQLKIVYKEFEEYGKFIWFIYNVGELINLKVKSQDITRLIYLATFINKDNELVKDGEYITRENLENILNVSHGTANNFYLDCVKLGIFEILNNDNKKNIIKINKQIFSYGKIKKTKNVEDTIRRRMRLFILSIRELYEQTNSKDHVRLGYLFLMIPFINFEFNILCHNPEEKTFENVKPMRMSEFLSMYDLEQRNWYYQTLFLKSIKINNTNPFIIISRGTEVYAYIDPRIYYSGKNFESIRYIKTLFEITD